MTHRPYENKPVRRGQPLIGRQLEETPGGFVYIGVPLIRYQPETKTIDSTNSEIVFRETAGAALLARVELGTHSWGALAYKVKKALEDAGGSTYTVTYDHKNHLFTLTSNGAGGGGIFQLVVGAAAYDLLPGLGFRTTQTGALTYTSELPVGGYEPLEFEKVLRDPQLSGEDAREETAFQTGASETAYYGGSDVFTGYVEHETAEVGKAVRDFWDSCARRGNKFEFYPDKTRSAFFEATWQGGTYPVRNTDVYRLLRVDFSVRFKVPPGASTLKPRDFMDRRPSS